MLTSTQYFGSPIDCISTGVDKGIVNTYCWTHGTYTVQNLEGVTNRPPTREEEDQMTATNHRGFVHPGMLTTNPTMNRRVYYYFYQWVAFVLFIQGACFYGPRFIWKKMVENGKMKFLTSGNLKYNINKLHYSYLESKVIIPAISFKICFVGMGEPALDGEEKEKRVIK